MNILQTIGLLVISVILTISCSTTPKLASQFSEQSYTPGSPGDLERLTEHAQRTSFDELNIFVTNDEENFYLVVDFVSARLFQLAKEFGFTLYIDNKSSTKRSFGITYPTGLYHELGNYPGARQGYLQEPNWGNFPENENMIQTAERNIFNNALLIQRSSRSDDMNPAPVPLLQLKAQNLHLHHDDDGRSGLIFYSIPIEIRSTSQFSPDAKIGETLEIGLEINPIRLYDIERGRHDPLITSETASGRGGSSDEDRQSEKDSIMRRLGSPFEQWLQVTLAEPPQ